MDPPAAPSSLHPMVNDLNLKLQGPNNKIIYPNGMKKEDSINNVEVIHGKTDIMPFSFAYEHWTYGERLGPVNQE
jgi:hypothetical protein